MDNITLFYIIVVDMETPINDIELQEYKKRIELIAEKKEPLVIYNSSPEHAVIIMSTIFRHADKTINIFADNFNGSISDKEEYQDELIKFIYRGGKLQVLLQEYNEENNITLFTKLNRLHKAFPDKVNIRKSNTKIYQQSEKSEKKEINFTVADGSMYRIEEDTKNKIAFCSFNDVATGGLLDKMFVGLFSTNMSESIY